MILSLLFAILASSCDAVDGYRSSSPPSPAPTIRDALTFMPEQVILPDAEFPLSGYRVSTDQRKGTDGWTRQWDGPGALSWVRVDVDVLAPSRSSREEIARTKCDWSFTPPSIGSAEITAPVVGDDAKACGYDFKDEPMDVMVYTTGTRNVVVVVSVERRTASQASAGEFIASIADYQLWILDRVAPLTGVALRPTPEVETPGVVATVTPQPTARTAAPAASTPFRTPNPATTPAPRTPSPTPTPTEVPVALSIVLNSYQCGPRQANMYQKPEGYLVQGFSATLTATGPVGSFILQPGFVESWQALDWPGRGPSGGPTRRSGDPASTRITASNNLHTGLLNAPNYAWTPFLISSPTIGVPGVQPTFRISC